MFDDPVISYAAHDRQIADTICAGLEARRIKCRVALRDNAPSTDYAEALIGAIEASRLFLLFLFGLSDLVVRRKCIVWRMIASAGSATLIMWRALGTTGDRFDDRAIRR